jgi:hypothetical protein
MTCIRILKSTVNSVYNSKPERIEGSRIFKVYLGSLQTSQTFNYIRYANQPLKNTVAFIPEKGLIQISLGF